MYSVWKIFLKIFTLSGEVFVKFEIISKLKIWNMILLIDEKILGKKRLDFVDMKLLFVNVWQ